VSGAYITCRSPEQLPRSIVHLPSREELETYGRTGKPAADALDDTGPGHDLRDEDPAVWRHGAWQSRRAVLGRVSRRQITGVTTGCFPSPTQLRRGTFSTRPSRPHPSLQVSALWRPESDDGGAEEPREAQRKSYVTGAVGPQTPTSRDVASRAPSLKQSSE